MNKLRVLMSVLLAATIFVACESDKDEPTPALKFDPATVEVVAEAETIVTVTEGTAPFTITVSEDDAKFATAAVEESKITVTGVAEGEATITVTDKNGVKGEIKVTVTAKDEEGDDTEGDDTEGDDTEGEGEE